VPSEQTARVAHRRFLRNRSVRRSLRTYRTKANRAIGAGPSEETQTAVRQAMQALDRAARKGVIHKNRAARTKSRLARRFNAVSASAGGQA
jgi:small subunit ribosomal protein S20